jgi:hypothetical protein
MDISFEYFDEYGYILIQSIDKPLLIIPFPLIQTFFDLCPERVCEILNISEITFYILQEKLTKHGWPSNAMSLDEKLAKLHLKINILSSLFNANSTTVNKIVEFIEYFFDHLSVNICLDYLIYVMTVNSQASIQFLLSNFIIMNQEQQDFFTTLKETSETIIHKEALQLQHIHYNVHATPEIETTQWMNKLDHHLFT